MKRTYNLIIVFLSFLASVQPLSTVSGLLWGRYCGSPSQPDPVIQWIESFEFAPGQIVPSSTSLVAWVMRGCSCLVLAEEHCQDEKRVGCISWGNADSFLTFKHYSSSRETVFDASRPDKVSHSSNKIALSVTQFSIFRTLLLFGFFGKT